MSIPANCHLYPRAVGDRDAFCLNTSSLKTVTSPLLILHAEDDNIVPHHMGLKVQSPSCFISSCVFPPRLAYLSPLQLYQISLQARKETQTDVQVEMISYSTSHGFYHNNIYLDPNLPDTIGYVLCTLECTVAL